MFGEFIGLLAFAYLSPLWFWRGLGALVSLPLATVPLAIMITREVCTKDGFFELKPMTRRLAMLTVAYSICLTLGPST